MQGFRLRKINGVILKKSQISPDEADWSRESKIFFSWDPSRSLIASLRRYQHASKSKSVGSFLWKRIAVLQHRFWSVVTGADIPLNCNIGGGLLLPHPNGVVIHPACKIGPNCLIFQQVTVGLREGGVPVLAGHVDIGAGAKVLGNIKIGVHVSIGANAVVLNDVPDYATAVGIPARIIEPDKSSKKMEDIKA